MKKWSGLYPPRHGDYMKEQEKLFREANESD